MKVLVTGATGLLGSHLVRELLQREKDVSVLLYSNHNPRNLEGLPVEKHFGNILDYVAVSDAMKGCDQVIHAAASTSIWPYRSEQTRAINIEGTRNVVHAAMAHSIRKLVHIGSASYVDSKGNLVSRDEYKRRRTYTDYVDSKFEAQHIVQDAVRKQGLPAISILPTYMIGAYDILFGTGKLVVNIANGHMRFYPGGGRNFVYVGDVATVICNALDSGKVGGLFVARGENLKYRELFERVAKLTSSRIPRRRIPDWLIKLYGSVNSLAASVFHYTPEVTDVIAREGCKDHYSYADTIYTELDMPRTSLDVAIEECYKWYKKEGFIGS